MRYTCVACGQGGADSRKLPHLNCHNCEERGTMIPVEVQETMLKYFGEENKALKQELMFACQFDGYVGVEKDKYDFAIEFMEESGRDEPSFEDEVNGLRKLIQLAMENEK